jgi:hypothetical protein
VGVGRERRERGVFIAARCRRVQNRAIAIWRATLNEEQVTKWGENSFVCDGRASRSWARNCAAAYDTCKTADFGQLNSLFHQSLQTDLQDMMRSDNV